MTSVAQLLPEVESIPWDRIVHFYGRANEIPAAIRDLAASVHETQDQALNKLSKWLEHQDKVVQATPFAVPFIIRTLMAPRVEGKSQIISMLRRFLNSARFVLEERARLSPEKVSRYLAADAHFWPPFESEEQDEILWEENDPSDEEFVAWQQLTEQAIAEHRQLFREMTNSDNPDLRRAASEMVDLIDSQSWIDTT